MIGITGRKATSRSISPSITSGQTRSQERAIKRYFKTNYMEICTMLSASVISQHPYITIGILLYAIVIGWVVYEMKHAPLVPNHGDELPLTGEELYDYSIEPNEYTD